MENVAVGCVTTQGSCDCIVKADIQSKGIK
jgi:hypothetical protein